MHVHVHVGEYICRWISVQTSGISEQVLGAVVQTDYNITVSMMVRHVWLHWRLHVKYGKTYFWEYSKCFLAISGWLKFIISSFSFLTLYMYSTFLQVRNLRRIKGLNVRSVETWRILHTSFPCLQFTLTITFVIQQLLLVWSQGHVVGFQFAEEVKFKWDFSLNFTQMTYKRNWPRGIWRKSWVSWGMDATVSVAGCVDRLFYYLRCKCKLIS